MMIGAMQDLQGSGVEAVARLPHQTAERTRTLAEVLRGDTRLVRAVREDRTFAVDLASALCSVPFVRMTRNGTVCRRMPSWACSAFQAATLVVEMRGMGEDPTEMLPSLDPSLILRNTATEIEDHINRLGWRVW
jgi:hypothetical protein